MSWLSLAIGAFGVMVYALLHSALTTEQALIVIGLSLLTTCSVFVFITSVMTRKYQALRSKLETLSAQSRARIETLKDLQEKVKAD